MSLVFAAIAPHGTMVIPGAEQPAERGLGLSTRAAMEELGRRLDASGAESVVVFTPHNVHVEGALAALVAGRLAGGLGDAFQSMWGEPPGIRVQCPVDRELAGQVVAEARGAGVPMVGVSFGGNAVTQAVMPMDWGALVPLWFMGGRREQQLPALVISPARDLGAEAHVAAGRAIRRAIDASGRRVAVVASADHGHAHREDGPYGFHPAAADYDRQVVALVEGQRLGEVVAIPPSLVADACADSWWQLLLLHGVLGDGWQGELLSYEAPTYFGMLCAAYEPL
jgi:aromatic ring-opening dioxygenase LigB subunit